MVEELRLNKQQSGMALLMVVLVLAALAAIGTPFLASMRLQESGAAKTLADHKARLAARSARDHAVSHLFDTYHSRERDFWTPGENAGDLVDDLEDLQVVFPESMTTEPLDQSESTTLTMRGEGDRILDAVSPMSRARSLSRRRCPFWWAICWRAVISPKTSPLIRSWKHFPAMRRACFLLMTTLTPSMVWW